MRSHENGAALSGEAVLSRGVEEMVELLAMVTRLHRDLGRRMATQRAAYLAGDARLLEEAVQVLGEIQVERHESASRMAALMERLAANAGDPGAGSSLTALARRLPPEAGRRILAARDEARAAAEEALVELGAGQRLLDFSADLHRALMGDLTATAPAASYDRRGGRPWDEPHRDPALLDARG